MSEPETHSDESDSPSPANVTTQPPTPSLRQRATSIASAGILIAIIATPIAGFLWLRGAIIHETEMNALWHTQTMLIRHLFRTRGEWPRSWDDLEEDFQPTNNSKRTDSIKTLQEHVDVDFNLDVRSIDPAETDEPPSFISLKSRRHATETQTANRQLREYIVKLRVRPMN